MSRVSNYLDSLVHSNFLTVHHRKYLHTCEIWSSTRFGVQRYFTKKKNKTKISGPRDSVFCLSTGWCWISMLIFWMGNTFVTRSADYLRGDCNLKKNLLVVRIDSKIKILLKPLVRMLKLELQQFTPSPINED